MLINLLTNWGLALLYIPNRAGRAISFSFVGSGALLANYPRPSSCSLCSLDVLLTYLYSGQANKSSAEARIEKK